MPTSLLEIVDLGNGEIVLQRAEEADADPLVRIQFSDESRTYLMDNGLEVARAMIQAGIETASQLAEVEVETEVETEEEELLDTAPRVLH